MKIGIISGSHRQDSQSAKIANYLANLLSDTHPQIEAWIHDLGKEPLPMWDEALFTGGDHWAPLSKLRQQCTDSDAFIIIAPEWHGMAPAAIKNFFLVLGNAGEIAHKPGLLVSLSVLTGGANALCELRMSSYKNSRICYIPEQLVIRNVLGIYNNDASTNNPEEHDYFVERGKYALNQLVEYAKALKLVRDSGAGDLAPYPNGM